MGGWRVPAGRRSTGTRTRRSGRSTSSAWTPTSKAAGTVAALTLAGLEWLQRGGASVGMLYVDAANGAARALYRSLGFSDDHVDRGLSLGARPDPAMLSRGEPTRMSERELYVNSDRVPAGRVGAAMDPDDDLEVIDRKVTQLFALVSQALAQATHALLDGNTDLAAGGRRRPGGRQPDLPGRAPGLAADRPRPEGAVPLRAPGRAPPDPARARAQRGSRRARRPARRRQPRSRR